VNLIISSLQTMRLFYLSVLKHSSKLKLEYIISQIKLLIRLQLNQIAGNCKIHTKILATKICFDQKRRLFLLRKYYVTYIFQIYYW